MVVRMARVAVLLVGDFWRGRDFDFVTSGPNLSEAWRKKIEPNIERERTKETALLAMGWIVLRSWQSELRRDVQEAVDRIEVAAVMALR